MSSETVLNITFWSIHPIAMPIRLSHFRLKRLKITHVNCALYSAQPFMEKPES